jgi:hypothetical protein
MTDHPRGTDNLMTSLKVLSQVKQNQKVATSEEVVRIENQDQWFSSLRRWYNGESRERNIDSISRVIDTAISQLELLQQKDHSASTQVFLVRLRQELHNAITGLTNLRCTYDQDSVTRSRIDLLIERIGDTLEHFSTKVNDGKTNNYPNHKKRG